MSPSRGPARAVVSGWAQGTLDELHETARTRVSCQHLKLRHHGGELLEDVRMNVAAQPKVDHGFSVQLSKSIAANVEMACIRATSVKLSAESTPSREHSSRRGPDQTDMQGLGQPVRGSARCGFASTLPRMRCSSSSDDASESRNASDARRRESSAGWRAEECECAIAERVEAGLNFKSRRRARSL